MQQELVFEQEKRNDDMVNVYADMQMDYLASSYSEPCVIEMYLSKGFGEYKVSLLFTCTDFSFVANSKSWSPYKAIQCVTAQSRDQILQRIYNSYSYA